MSKRFRPIFATEKGSEETFRDEIQSLLDEKRRLEERVRGLEEEVKVLKEKNVSLQEEVGRLKGELAVREKELNSLKEEIRSREALSKVVEALKDSVEQRIGNLKEDLKEEFLSLAKEVIREFLMTDVIPKEAVVTTVLEEVFKTVADVRGRVTVFLSPKDLDRVFDLLADLKERIGDRVEVEISSDPSLKEGEVRIETPKFIIERRNDEILEEVFREVLRHAFERGKDIREGGQGKRDIP